MSWFPPGGGRQRRPQATFQKALVSNRYDTQQCKSVVSGWGATLRSMFLHHSGKISHNVVTETCDDVHIRFSLTRHGGCVESKVSQILPSKKWGNQREDVIHNNNIIIINTARRELTHQPLLKHFLKSLVIVKSMRNSSVLTPKPYSINKPYHRILIWFWQ